ncbi:MAG: hypothetical protein NDJ92_12545 [Thermoanaerobaculia bacterium]|nr:hypothetical protein [Thermoanaerobaculia bacterium]
MEDQSFEEWLEDFATGTFPDGELEEIGSGVRHASEIDVKNLVREVQFLRALTRRLHARLGELGDGDSPLSRYTSLVIEGVRPDAE